MRPSLLLRIASIAMLLFAAGHTMGGLQFWSPAGDTEILKAMGSFRFDVQGVNRTYLDFYLGFGWTISVYLFLQAVLLWQLAPLAGVEPHRVRPLLVSFLVAWIAATVISSLLIFPLPAVLSAVVTAFLAAVLFRLRALPQ